MYDGEQRGSLKQWCIREQRAYRGERLILGINGDAQRSGGAPYNDTRREGIHDGGPE